MKQYFTSLVAFIVATTSFSQDTIKLASLPQPGWTYIVSNDASTQYAIPAGSQSAQTWDYSNLIESYQKVPTYDSTSETMYATDFPNSNIYTYGPAYLYSGLFGSAPVGDAAMSKGYMFWRTDQTGFWSEGFLSETGTVANVKNYITPSELILPIPGYLNATYNNESSFSYDINFDASNYDTLYVSRSTKTFEYDAFGTLTTPHGVFTNVVRLHEYKIKVDSVFAIQNGQTVYEMEYLRDTTNTYFYIDKNTEYPVMTTYANKNNTVLFTEYYKAKVVSTMGVPATEETANIQVYPNPATSTLTVATSSQNSTISIYNLEGRKLATHAIEKNTTIDVSNLQSGMYLITQSTKDGKQLQMIKFCKN